MSAIPNTFQTPNVVVDKVMFLLVESELKCLLFMMRHILGWQDRVEDRKGRISQSAFVNGFTDSKGNHYAGTGLSQGTVRSALRNLEKYNLAEKGTTNNDGTEWGIAFLNGAEIKFEELQERWDKKQRRRQKQTIPARKSNPLNIKGVQSNSTPTVEQHPYSPTVGQGYSPTVGQGVQSNSTHTNPTKPNQTHLTEEGTDLQPITQVTTPVIDFGHIAKMCADEIEDLTPFISQRLDMWYEDVKPEWLIEAMKEAVMQGVRKWVYVEGILKRYQKEGQSDEDKRQAAETKAAGRHELEQQTRDKYAAMASELDNLQKAG